MNDDWRLQVDFGEPDRALTLTAHLEADKLEHELSREFHDRLIVSVDGTEMFVYAGSREQDEEARALIEREAQARGWTIAIDFRRWHPTAEEWEDPDLPLPGDGAARRAEREELMMREREETAANGYPEFEVRADLDSRHDAVALTKKLRDEGIPAVRRWKFLLVGATDEDSAKELADRIRQEGPSGTRAKVEGTVAAVRHNKGPNPFTVWR